MTIELLVHHVMPHNRRYNYEGVFDGWEDRGLLPTMKDIQRRVIPSLKRAKDKDGKPIYPFLTKDPKKRQQFEKRWLECYLAFLRRDFKVIPDFDPKTKKANKDYLCAACPNWEEICQSKTTNEPVYPWP